MDVDVDAAIDDALAWMRRTFPQADWYHHCRSDDERPGGWVIVARMSAGMSTAIHTRLICVNMETGERRLKTGWWPGQPLELSDVRPDWVAALPRTLPPLVMERQYPE